MFFYVFEHSEIINLQSFVFYNLCIRFYEEKLTWDDTTKKVVFIGTTSDKCYIYFGN